MPRMSEVCSTVFCPHPHSSKPLYLSNIASGVLRILPPAVCRVPTVLSAVCLLLLLSTQHSALSTVYAQSATATLSGTVVDQNGAVVPDVKIAVISIAQGFQRSATTKEEGTFVVPSLPPGNYTVKAEHEGFTPTEVRDLALNVNDQVSIRIQLKVGTVTSQTVEIVESTSLIDDSPTVGTLVDRQFVANLPLNGRSFQSLIALTPGVVLTKTNFGEQGQFSVNGQRANTNYFTVDGVSANAGTSAVQNLVQSAGGALPALSAAGGTNSLVSVDAMQEFKIQTSTFAPEFGRTPGAQISIVTRSGTNDFHGTLFEYLRNDALDANDWFANSRGLKRPALRQNDFGFVLGGPILLPRFGEGLRRPWYNGRNKSFFFFSYEGLRLRLPQTAVTLVPSVASRQAAVPQIQPFLNAYPVPNGQVFSNGFAEFNATYSDPLNLDATSIRIDHAFDDRLTLFGRYNYSPSKTTQRGTATSGISVNSLNDVGFKTQTFTLGVTQSLRTTVSNELRANYSRSEGTSIFRLDSFGSAVIPADTVLFPPFASSQNSLLTFQINGGRILQLGRNVENIQRQINLTDNLSIVKDTHQLKFGVDYRLLLPVNGPREYNERVVFSGLTGARGAIGGVAQSASARAQEVVALKFTNFSAYAQDTWKVASRVTLTYGLRWDVNPAPTGRNGKNLVTFENIDNLAGLRLAPKGTPLYETTHKNFAPRVGISYQLSQKKGLDTILRGGVGIFYDLGFGSLANASAGFPHASNNTFSGVPFPLTAAQAAPPPFSLNIPASGNAFVADRNLNLPRTYQWNASLEQSIGSNQTFSATYIGAAGRRLLRADIAIVPPAFFVTTTRNTATSDYHAMQLQFQRRLSKGLQALASYTWSHSIDIASNDSNFGSTPGNPILDRGSSDFDVRHAFNMAVTYDLPRPKLGSAAKLLFMNWSVDMISTARSATPVDLVADFPFIGGFQASVRPDLIPGVPIYIDDQRIAGGRRFNRAAFGVPSGGRQGTLGRNVLRGFPVVQFDLALRRQFMVTERVKLQLRAEFFNLLNHPNFGDPGNNQGNSLASPQFGQSTSMLGRSLGGGGTSGGFNPIYQVGGPRSTQLAVKLQF